MARLREQVADLAATEDDVLTYALIGLPLIRLTSMLAEAGLDVLGEAP